MVAKYSYDRRQILAAWMTPGRWYVQKFSDQELYFRMAETLKNGNFSGSMITLDLTRPRARPKAKKISVFKTDVHLWKEISEADVPASVRDIGD